jgi:hypothetical protein
MNDTTRELGGALGVAVLGSLVTSTYASSIGDALAGLTDSQTAVARTGLVGAFSVAREVGGDGGAIVEAAKQAFVDGIGVAAIAGATVVALAAVFAHRSLPRTATSIAPAIPASVDEVLEEDTAPVPA